MSFVNNIPAEERKAYETIQRMDTNYVNPLHSIFSDIYKAHYSKKIITTSIFENTLKQNIVFEKCYFIGELIIVNATFEGTIEFNNCYFDHSILLQDGNKFKKTFDIINCTIREKILITGGEFDICRFSFLGNPYIKVNGGTFRELNIGYYGGSRINKLSFDCRKILGYIIIGGASSEIDEISFNFYSSDLTIAIEDLTLRVLQFYRFKNIKSVVISNVQVSKAAESEFSINESAMGKAEFYNLNISRFSRATFHNSNIVECSFINVRWPNKISAFKGNGIFKSEEEIELENSISKIENGRIEDFNTIDELKNNPAVKNYYSELKELFRQLKYAYSKQGDSVTEQHFHALEMRAYHDSLDKLDNYFTRLIIKFSYFFSNFGTSITRPLKGLFFGHGLLLLILVWLGGIDTLKLEFHPINWASIKESFFWFLKLVNPFRKADDITGNFILIDTLMRIWSSLMIYNIIRASRRFIK